MISISIIIPTFNRGNYLRVILSNIISQNLPNDVSTNTIVIVDGSIDETLEMLKTDFPDIHVVNGDGNWWYTKCMNEGFKYAQKLNPDFVLTLNDDIEINSNYIQSLIDAYSNVGNNAIIGSLSVSTDKPYKVTSSGNILKNSFWGIYKHRLPFMSVQKLTELTGVHKTESLPGRGMLIPFQTLKELNYFDEMFAQYHSDTDFCLRAKKQGIEVYVSWDAVIFSHIGLTSDCSSFKKQKLAVFIKSFSNKYSRNYIPSRSLYICRHQTKFGLIIVMTFKILLNFKNYFFKRNTI